MEEEEIVEVEARYSEKEKYAVFDKEFMPHIDSMYNFAFRLTNDEDDANDLVQDTYLKAFRFINSFERGTNAKAWLFRILKNSFINDYRKRSKQSVINDSTPNDFIIDQTHTKVLNQGITNLNMREVNQMIFELPELFRIPFNLYFEGYKYNEIADELGEPLGTIKSRIHFARKILKQKIERY